MVFVKITGCDNIGYIKWWSDKRSTINNSHIKDIMKNIKQERNIDWRIELRI